MDDALKHRIKELVREEVAIVAYDKAWPKMFETEANFLKAKLPAGLLRRIEHFGSTAVPGLSAKPIIDILVEVADLDETKDKIVPILLSEGYEYFWRPASGNEGPPYYAWFIKRNASGQRTHHIHMVESDSELWDRLFFRDYLREFPDIAKKYETMKINLSEQHTYDRVRYTNEKSVFILSLTQRAKEYYQTHR